MIRRVIDKPEILTPQDMKTAVNRYFDDADREKIPYTISGLCMYIGYTKQDFVSAPYNTQIGFILLQARLLIEQQYEILLLTSKKTTGVIFALKNLGWSDSNSLDIGFKSAKNGEELKWTVEIVAPGETEKPKKDIVDLPKEPLSLPAAQKTIEMKPEHPSGAKPLLRESDVKPWYVAAAEAKTKIKQAEEARKKAERVNEQLNKKLGVYQKHVKRINQERKNSRSQFLAEQGIKRGVRLPRGSAGYGGATVRIRVKNS